jgi:TFIIF-interacting CTD phosphatase-like protein
MWQNQMCRFSIYKMRKRLNIVLDLDNTLISAKDNHEEAHMSKDTLSLLKRKLQWENMDDEFKVFARPYLQKFLSWLFKNFNVMVWTAASGSYALYIIDKFILNDRNRDLKFFLYSNHCKQSYLMYDTQKKLDMLKKYMPSLSLNDTIIIDDNKEVYASQPENCIHIKPFDVAHKSCIDDVELLNVQKRLEKIRINRMLLDNKGSK